MRRFVLLLPIALLGCSNADANKVAQLEAAIKDMEAQLQQSTDETKQLKQLTASIVEQLEAQQKQLRSRELIIVDELDRPVFWAGKNSDSSGIMITNSTTNTHIAIGAKAFPMVFFSHGATPVKTVEWVATE